MDERRAGAEHEVLNFNVGLLGHVDSGKTALARALSTTASTAAFDKHPQSQERGITLDLGFSSLTVDTPGTSPPAAARRACSTPSSTVPAMPRSYAPSSEVKCSLPPYSTGA
ncbi:hypothetical protein PR048_032143 [Dryococelus australis]|uniref:Tr-type G domain-containing protein n=1 Tax=Dryococelus australis TaxID=614101 RepID=A0ABQ9G1E3_9NEOP|nr:hypothetical protein PR048_032143 [Dryococelus australis]